MFTLSRKEVRELDRRAINESGVPGVVLMENAGRGCAELLMRLNPDRQPVVILCGPGNNGGDGFVLARHLDNHGWPVTLVLLADPKRLSPDATISWQPLHDCPWAFALPEATPGDLKMLDGLRNCFESERQGWFVDALYGTGLNRPLDVRFGEYFTTLEASEWAVLAVDIPSGLDCDTGEPLGPTLRAAHTATFVAHKRGFLNPASRAWTGEVHVIDIGAPRALVDEYRKGGDRPA